MRTKALDEGNCAAARPGGKEAGVKTTSPRTETGCEAGDADELAPHSEVRVSASQVKPGVVSRKSPPLPGETCPAGAAAGAQSAVAGNSGGQRTGVSRGRSSTGNEPGVGVHLPWGALKGPDGLTHVRRPELIGTAETAASFQLELALNADSAEERGPAAETDRGQGELWERVLSPENLNEAWRRVRENGGAAGIDRMSVAAFPAILPRPLDQGGVQSCRREPKACPTCKPHGSPIITRRRRNRVRRPRRRRRRSNQIGTARYGPVRRVVWGPVANHYRLPDWPNFSSCWE